MTREIVNIQDHIFTFETDLWAQQADGSVVLRVGDAVVLITVVASTSPSNAGFFPLTVEYGERMAAAGRIPGSVRRREGRSSTEQILSSRLIDRSLRPLFPDGFQNETQIVAMVFSADPDVDTATLSITGASIALMLSPIPWDGPVVGLRVARVDGELLAFPTQTQRARADMDFVVSVADTGVLMVEGDAQEVREDDLVALLAFAQTTAQPVLAWQRDWQARDGDAKRTVPDPMVLPEHVLAVFDTHRDAIAEALQHKVKKSRGQAKKSALSAALNDATTAFDGATPEQLKALSSALDRFAKQVGRDLILAGKRFDGRSPTKVRPLQCDIHPLPAAHGSAVFTRGETQAIASCTLGGPRESLRHYDLFGARDENFFLHYNFPPYSVGEVRPMRGPGRREIGHGMLAQRALSMAVPDNSEFPYTIRVVSDILSSNGSSSMATVCAGSLAMLDAGVPLKAPVAGIAMGMIKQGDDVAILTDILGDEDHLGDMDFKVCGTRKGVTALQMDLKIDGLTEGLLARALQQARHARIQILDAMKRAFPAARPDVAASANKVHIVKIRPEKIGDLIGPGGRTIKGIKKITDANIDVDDDGTVRIAAPDRDGADEARLRVMQITKAPVVGQVYNGTIVRARHPIAVVELFPGTEGILFVDDWDGSGRFEDAFQLGDPCRVRIKGVDNRGRITVTARNV